MSAIRASIQTSAIGGITLGIVVKQRTEFTPSIISATQRGSIKELRSFFVSESLRIDHVDDINGRSALHYAMYSITIDIDRVRMLLQYGSDPDHEDDLGESVRHIVARKVLTNSDERPILQDLELLLPISKAVSDFEFNFIHKVVVGLCPVNLGLILQASDKTVLDQMNGQDNLGKTPLHWAVARADLSAIRALLAAGANVNIFTHKGHTSLMESLVWQKDPTCAFAVMDAGVDLERRDLDGFLPFHHAIGFNRLPVAARMIEMGVDVESRTTNAQETALAIAARRNLVGLVEYLCDQGADLNALDRWGWTPLLRAIESKAHDTLKMLLDRGANHTRRTPTGATILHIAAIRGNVETFDILASGSLNGMDVEAKDQKDHPATYYFEDENTNLDNPEAEPAFRRLLRAMEHTMAEAVPSAQDHVESDGEADCHFVDAQELLKI
ncbi:hypothetical protein LTS18_003268 [Coniosporium uncinatum]|uniref:Uncharacterized protein n=1 Tax=Coniosporium uncinatum TaxID=93489 RepID=A0ACC3DTQ9_9PEZI|nr:hypothetical protein LTS18_003268 [Coniosporium uncinatum]